MSSSIVIALISLVCVVSGGLVDRPSGKTYNVRGFSWQSCSSSEDTLAQVLDIQMPDVLTIPGTNHIALTLNIKEDLVSKLWLKMKLVKWVFGLLPVPIPCISNIGSCTYEDVCPLLDEFYAENNRCPGGIPEEIVPCRCPIPKTDGFETTEVDFTIGSDAIGPLLSFLASGEYEITVEAMLNDVELGCVELEVEIVQG